MTGVLCHFKSVIIIAIIIVRDHEHKNVFEVLTNCITSHGSTCQSMRT